MRHTTPHRWIHALLVSLGTLAGCAATADTERPGHVPEGYDLAYASSFDAAEAVEDFHCTDADAWRWAQDDQGNGYLELHGKSDYKPKHRSPYNIALLKTPAVGSFVLDLDMQQSGREYGHRDLCIFFGFNDPEHYYYTHLATKGDQNAHQVFIVNDKPRTPITTDRTEGVDWASDWKHIRVVRDAEAGTIAVYFEDMDKPVQVASDKTFTRGYIGFGSFDDVGRVDNVRLWAKSIEKKQAEHFEPLKNKD